RIPSLSSSIQTPHPSALSTLSLHDALPIYRTDIAKGQLRRAIAFDTHQAVRDLEKHRSNLLRTDGRCRQHRREDERLDDLAGHRSEEHTSELQSRSDLVCRLLLEKKKQQKN